MKAMILAAGLGTRLFPLTQNKPKALVQVGAMTLLEFSIRRLLSFGFQDIIINIHHFGEQIEAFLDEHQYFGASIQLSDEREMLLDTGGAIKQAAPWLDGDPFLLLNTDVITDIDLKRMWEVHSANRPLATLAVRQRQSSRYLLFDGRDQLVGWQHVRRAEFRWCGPPRPDARPLAFSGIQILDPAIFSFFPETDRFSIIDVYLAACGAQRVLGYPHDPDQWMDAGKIEDLPQAGELLNRIAEAEGLL